MEGTVIITGANGSLGLPFVKQILSSYPPYTVVGTVRNPSTESDPNTAQLAKVVASHGKGNAHIESLNLSSLADVRSFAERIAKRVAAGDLPPIAAIVCNAFAWSLNGQSTTLDGYETTFQVSHLAHYLLVLKLLGFMSPSGRVVMLGSDSHYTDRPHPLSKHIAEVPTNLEFLVKPTQDAPGDEHDRGFQRYGTAKLASIMFMHDLNSRLQKDPKLSGITVTAMDPCGLVDSRAHAEQRPAMRVAFSVVNFLVPALRFVTSQMRRSADAAKDLAQLSVGQEFKTARGYYKGTKVDTPTKISLDEKEQYRLWAACWDWVSLTAEETALANAQPHN